jgi:hypothetical protein
VGGYAGGFPVYPCRLICGGEGVWKGDGDLHFVVDGVYATSSQLPGSKVGEVLVYVGLE